MLNKKHKILTPICICFAGLSLPTTSSSAVNKNSCQNVFTLKNANTSERIEKVESEIIQLIKTIDSETDIIKRSTQYQKLFAVWQEYHEYLSAKSNDLINQKIRQIRSENERDRHNQKEEINKLTDQRLLTIDLKNNVTGEVENIALKKGDLVYYFKIIDESLAYQTPDEDYRPSKVDLIKARIIDFNSSQTLVENTENGLQNFINNTQILPIQNDKYAQITYLIQSSLHNPSDYPDSHSNEIHFGQLMSINIYGLDMRGFAQSSRTDQFQALNIDNIFFNFKNQNSTKIDLSQLRQLTQLLLNKNYLIPIEDLIRFTDFFIKIKINKEKLNNPIDLAFDFNIAQFNRLKSNQSILNLPDLLYRQKNDLNSLDLFDAALFAMMSRALLFRTPQQSNQLYKHFSEKFENSIKPYYRQLLKSEFGSKYRVQLQNFARNIRQGLLPTEMTMEQVINEIKLKQRELK